jgi:hypothetical protein
MGVKIKNYEFSYEFIVNGEMYKGMHTFSQIPSTNSLPVYYLSNHPAVNCVDPENQLAIEKKKNVSKEPLYWGIGWGVLCLLTVAGFIGELRKKKDTSTIQPSIDVLT